MMKESYGVFKLVNGQMELDKKGFDTVGAATAYIKTKESGAWTYQKLFFPTGESGE